jgi:hypothetical protein
MRWTPGGKSEDIEDRRGETPAGGGFGGGGMRLGLGGFLVLAVLSIVFKQDFFALLSGGPEASVAPAPSASTRPGPSALSRASEDQRVQFVSFVLDDAQKTWGRLLEGKYERAKLVLFTGAIDSACGFASAASGPFYCPGDRKVYIDLAFYDALQRRFGAPGEFAEAYVVAHELGHHVQNLLGIEREMRRAQESRPDLANSLLVRLELQADCLAGVWGHSTNERGILESGDVESGLNAAAAIGDDRLQRSAGRGVHPESFTHGSSAQRVRWFRRGLETGNIAGCDTFRARDL